MPKLVGEFRGGVPVKDSYESMVELPYYIEDPYLEFLGQVSNADLNPLVELITSKLTEELTQKKIYKRFYPDHRMYWKDIAAEIQTFGGNSIANFFRGHGVPYKEVLTDVCKRLGIKDPKNRGVIELEKDLLVKIIEDTLERLTIEEVREIISELDSDSKETSGADNEIERIKQGIKTMSRTKKCPGWLATQIAQVIVKKIGFWRINKIVLTILNWLSEILIGRGLSLAVNAMISKILGKAYNLFTGPIGWGITISWSIIDLAGPAYRVTIPCCFYIAFLRRKILNS